ncbi:hypothetical protein KJ632_03295 [Patescibacteria group bacterium]|nr:hypothetical protein [Patescibacteria group bacterium]
MSKKTHTVIKWLSIILSIALLAFGLPFYFGYGNPLPFINPDYTLWDNIWLTIFPIMFIGLAFGCKWQKLGGWLVTVSVGAGLLLGLLIEGELVFHMLVPLSVGVLFLFAGYKD